MKNYPIQQIKILAFFYIFLLFGCETNYSNNDFCKGDSTSWDVVTYNGEYYKDVKNGYTFYPNGFYYAYIYQDSFNKLPVIMGLYDADYPHTVEYCKFNWGVDNNILRKGNTFSTVLYLNEDSIALKSFSGTTQYTQILRKVKNRW